MIGISIFDKAELAVKICRPAGHVANIIELPDGRTRFVDLHNGRKENFTLSRKNMSYVSGVKTFRAENADEYYQVIPVFDKEVIIYSILDNLNSLQHEIVSGSQTFEPEAIAEARRFYDQHHESFEGLDLSGLIAKMFPELTRFNDSDIMITERHRVEEMEK